MIQVRLERGGRSTDGVDHLVGCRTVGDVGHAGVAGAVRAAVDLSNALHTMANDAASAMRALRSQFVDGALERVEGERARVGANLETLVVIVAADVTRCHG